MNTLISTFKLNILLFLLYILLINKKKKVWWSHYKDHLFVSTKNVKVQQQGNKRLKNHRKNMTEKMTHIQTRTQVFVQIFKDIYPGNFCCSLVEFFSSQHLNNESDIRHNFRTRTTAILKCLRETKTAFLSAFIAEIADEILDIFFLHIEIRPVKQKYPEEGVWLSG